MRGRALRLQEYEDSICKCGCGLPMVEAHKSQPFAVHEFTCHAAKAVETYKRIVRTEAERLAKKVGDGKLPDGWGDGVHYYPTLTDPS